MTLSTRRSLGGLGNAKGSGRYRPLPSVTVGEPIDMTVCGGAILGIGPRAGHEQSGRSSFPLQQRTTERTKLSEHRELQCLSSPSAVMKSAACATVEGGLNIRLWVTTRTNSVTQNTG